MDLKKYIKVYDNCCNLNQVGNFLKYINNKATFKDATIINDGKNPKVDKNIRNTKIWTPSDDKLSDVHWLNFYTSIIKTCINIYHQDLSVNTSTTGINRLSVLKYEEGGFYETHTDYHLTQPRNLSVIFFLNDDYEGGSLLFKNPNNLKKNILEVKPKAARIIVWPSNFLYPHQVKTVLKGTRFTIVAWAI